MNENRQIDVVIIGGGPAGLSAGIELKKLGVSRIVIIEREEETGGIPRYCGHSPFGMREFKRVLSGKQYANKLTKQAQKEGVEIWLSTNVVKAQKNGKLLITNNDGLKEIKAKRVIYATGVRETPRSARLISGTRAQGVLNTGALQTMIYRQKLRPFKRPIIIGTELVAFSAIMTCLHAKIKPVAMIEESSNVIARWPSSIFPRLTNVPLFFNTSLVNIKGDTQVSAVEVEDNNGRREIKCDGVILTGKFIPEASLARCGHLEIDPLTNGLKVDQFGRCSDPTYFATGNVLRPVETAGWSWKEGKECAKIVAKDLAGRALISDEEVQIIASDALIKYIMPQKITLPFSPDFGVENLQLRFLQKTSGNLIALSDEKVIFEQKINVTPERRVLVPIKKLLEKYNNSGQIIFKFTRN